MNIRAVARLLYGFVAVVFLLAGVIILLLHTGILPVGLRELVLDITKRDLNAIHLIQELASQ